MLLRFSAEIKDIEFEEFRNLGQFFYIQVLISIQGCYRSGNSEFFFDSTNYIFHLLYKCITILFVYLRGRKTYNGRGK